MVNKIVMVTGRDSKEYEDNINAALMSLEVNYIIKDNQSHRIGASTVLEGQIWCVEKAPAEEQVSIGTRSIGENAD
jgi:hypothetical protein